MMKVEKTTTKSEFDGSTILCRDTMAEDECCSFQKESEDNSRECTSSLNRNIYVEEPRHLSTLNNAGAHVEVELSQDFEEMRRAAERSYNFSKSKAGHEWRSCWEQMSERNRSAALYTSPEEVWR